jgi:hypothetical protein
MQAIANPEIYFEYSPIYVKVFLRVSFHPELGGPDCLKLEEDLLVSKFE